MYISPCKKYVFLATPRAGSRSIKELLLANGWVRHGAHHEIVGKLIRPDQTVACIVRQHHDLLVSWYLATAKLWTCSHCQNRERVPIAEYLQDFTTGNLAPRVMKYFPPQSCVENGSGSLFGLYMHHATDLIRYESLAEDTVRIFGPALSKTHDLPHVGATEGKHRKFWKHYDKFWLLRIRRIYTREMSALNYLYPPN